ncbi:D-2-hydroxyacid dehydrogenase [Prochlorococcus marinus XMU1414]|uniref:D-2-hydroxyacid dehydrogenase n=1 Tax=Prochlorococcus marinus XMU1424 TaxID=2774497 RepID=A0A9D9FZA1_PROMR|nr:D-2-hydroxyacid dehydrogenase [Prochlorococcus marinus]MBO8228669.1 D-2-hydroxyacid dehydrogenase [Prochlorococcus marinus XMU1414]MBW3046148.1 hydroxyacid dehydrogenase [Prochlorococcus marinus str. MU1414]MCR8531560.1 D-2-hydroxyacid dehydrogenase [Prochlorococcus marinus XMU1420]MCR8535289.1 D-2-hydroxyacid dehydrogenase [Prochlorococcus marinus XMU1424]
MDDTKKILFLQKKEFLKDQSEFIISKLKNFDNDINLDSISEFSKSFDYSKYSVIIAPTLPWIYEVINKSSNLKWIHFLSSGIEKIWDMPVDWSRYLLSKSAGIHGPQISEYVIGSMLFFAKRFNDFNVQSRDKIWKRFWLSELKNKHVLILGGGNVGHWISKRCSQFEMEITIVQKNLKFNKYANRTLILDDAINLLGTVDFIVVALPLTENTRLLIDDEFLSKLSKGAVLIDISRGGIVNQNTVIKFLEQDKLGGAALDVFAEEPLPASSPLWNRKDVLVTPHVSGTSPFYMERALELFIENLKSLKSNGQLITPVSIKDKY